eukprot:scaffold4186_cov110-Isochrysis_galbana.AAC.9
MRASPRWQTSASPSDESCTAHVRARTGGRAVRGGVCGSGGWRATMAGPRQLRLYCGRLTQAGGGHGGGCTRTRNEGAKGARAVSRGQLRDARLPHTWGSGPKPKAANTKQGNLELGLGSNEGALPRGPGPEAQRLDAASRPCSPQDAGRSSEGRGVRMCGVRAIYLLEK